MSELTAERLRELLLYNPGTGIFRWRVRRGMARAGSIAGRPSGDGHIQISVDGRRYGAHRLAWLYVHGRWPEHLIDHINGVRDDNRIANLRDATHEENARNCARYRSSRSCIKGVTFRASHGRWRATIRIGGAPRHLGYFDTAEEAAAAYATAAAQAFGEFVRAT